jgi:hypothetical protein
MAGTKKSDLIKAASQIDLKTLERIASIIDTHEGVKDDVDYISHYRDPFYWRVSINQLQHKEVFKIDREEYSKESHNVGRLYRSQGMSILPNSQQYAALQEVMDYIKSDMTSSENIHNICEDQQTELEKDKVVHPDDHEQESGKDIILFCGRKFKLREKYRSEYAMDTIEEFYIKAVAVSIMAESDGNSQVAKEILDNGGMAIVKNLNQESVMELLQELQIIALEGEDLGNENEGMTR